MRTYLLGVVVTVALVGCGQDTTKVCKAMNRGLSCARETLASAEECDEIFADCDDAQLERWERGYRCVATITCRSAYDDESIEDILSAFECFARAPLDCAQPG